MNLGCRIVLLSIAAAIIAGCSGDRSTSLAFAVGGTPNELDFWDSLVTRFERQSGIDVTLLRQPTDTDQRRQNLVVPFKGRQTDPDVFLMDVAWIAQFAASGWLHDLGPSIEKTAGYDTIFFEGVMSSADRYNGAHIALPVYVDAGVLYFRRDLLERHNLTPPKTWDDLIRQSKAVMKTERKSNPSFAGFLWQGAQYEGLVCTFLEFAGSQGGIIGDDGRLVLNSQPNIRALSLMRALIADAGVSPPSTYTEMKEEEVRQVFQQGNALFERNWPYAWALHQAPDSPVRSKVGIAPLPSFADGQSVSTLGGWHIGVSAFTDQPDNAWKLVEYVTSAPVQKELALHLGWNPSRKDIYADSEIAERLPHLGELRSVFEHARSRPMVPYYSHLSELLQRHLNAALAGTMTPELALAAAQSEAEAIVKRYSVQ